MKTESRWYSETAHAWIAEGEVKGKVEGKVEVLLRILDSRGVELTEEQRRRISGCRELGQIEAWVDRALTAISADELFA